MGASMRSNFFFLFFFASHLPPFSRPKHLISHAHKHMRCLNAWLIAGCPTNHFSILFESTGPQFRVGIHRHRIGPHLICRYPCDISCVVFRFFFPFHTRFFPNDGTQRRQEILSSHTAHILQDFLLKFTFTFKKRRRRKKLLLAFECGGRMGTIGPSDTT